MSNRYRHLWREVVSLDNLYLAFQRAAKGKRGKPAASTFERRLDENIYQLREELQNGSYCHGPYDSFHIHDPKIRLISAAPFRDRVAHHALCNVIEPLFERQFIYDTYANRVGKGNHKALDRCTQFLRRFEYVLPLDAQKFFPSIDHQILEGILSRTIGDEKVMALFREIIASGRVLLDNEYEMVYFPGDDLLAATRGRGLPIGNLTSQFWANVYLSGLDHFAKRELKCRGYIRFVDDVLMFSDSKRDLHALRTAVIDHLAGLRLTIHEQCAQPRPCTTGVPYLGFQVFRDHRRLKRPKVLHARRRLKMLAARYAAGEIEREALEASLRGWINHASTGDTWGLRRDVLRSAGLLAQFEEFA